MFSVLLVMKPWCLAAMSRFLYPEPLDVQRSRDYRAIDTMVGLQEAVNTIRVAHYPVWMLKYLPLKIMKEGREGFRKFKMASLSIMKEMEEKKSSTSEDPAEGTFYEQFRARGMPDNTILAIMADFLAAGTDTVSLYMDYFAWHNLYYIIMIICIRVEGSQYP